MQHAHTFTLTISQVDKLLFSGEVYSVTLPGQEGELTMLAQHEPLITLLTRGTITIRLADGTQQVIPLEKGVLEASAGQVTVLI